MKKITMQDIADIFDVSKVTVHKALTGGEGISRKLCSEIKTKAESMGYIYKKNRYIKKHNFIYLAKRLFFLYEEEQFYSKIYKYLEEECRNNGAELTLEFYETNEDKKKLTEVIYSNKNLYGIFVAGQLPYKDMEELQKLPLPVIFIDYYSPVFNFNYIYLNNYHNTYHLIDYLVKKGHKEIGFIGHINYVSALTDRYFGYRKAILDYNLPYNKEWHINENIDKRVQFDIDLPKKLPSAFICHCDLTAKKLYLKLNLLGLKIPDDISVISFDNTQICYELNPNLTSMGIDLRFFAKNAIEIMQNKLNDNSYDKNIELKADIIERQSVKAKNCT